MRESGGTVGAKSIGWGEVAGMGEFGRELRRERDARGISLETIAEVTKISTRHLLALEEENFKALPGGVLNKGIVRGYTRACGMDEEDWVRRYLVAYGESGQRKDDDQAWVAFAENVGTARKGEMPKPDTGVRWAGVAVMLAVLACFAWYVARFVEEKSVAFAPTGALTCCDTLSACGEKSMALAPASAVTASLG